MNSYDLLLGMDEGSFNKAIDSLYKKKSLRKNIFKGSKSQKVNNPIGKTTLEVRLNWDVLKVPIVSFKPPTDSEWKNAYKEDGTKTQLTQNSFLVKFPETKVAWTEIGIMNVQKKETTLKNVSAVCTVKIDLESNFININAIALILDLSKATPTDKLIYKTFIIPAVLQATEIILSTKQIPNIDFHGAKFGKALVYVGGGRLIGAANLSSKTEVPTVTDTSALPNKPFFILMSKETSQSIVDKVVHQLEGKKQTSSGSKNFGLGDADYEVEVYANQITAKLSQDPTKVLCNMDVTIDAKAGIDPIIPIVGVVINAALYMGSVVVNIGEALIHGDLGEVVEIVEDVVEDVVDEIKDIANDIADAFSSY
ncbi:hypothetical protein ACQV5M_16725 [Leptospira sp. SA-E8]|uniref:hypothetical protein n=1 Tax=Leptospira sp. SA-E8 TaxID=3422259 RepID=UPI003EBE0919